MPQCLVGNAMEKAKVTEEEQKQIRAAFTARTQIEVSTARNLIKEYAPIIKERRTRSWRRCSGLLKIYRCLGEYENELVKNSRDEWRRPSAICLEDQTVRQRTYVAIRTRGLRAGARGGVEPTDARHHSCYARCARHSPRAVGPNEETYLCRKGRPPRPGCQRACVQVGAAMAAPSSGTRWNSRGCAACVRMSRPSSSRRASPPHPDSARASSAESSGRPSTWAA